MRRPPVRSNIRPKISTMPRQKSEAAAILDVYKLVVERKRLQQELDSIEQRRQQIEKRLGIIENQVNGLEGQIQHLREQTECSEPSQSQASPPPQSGSFDTMFLEY